MKFKRFYVTQALGELASKALQDGITLTSQAALVNQLKNVFRLGKGDEIVLFDNSGEDYYVSLESLEKDSFTFRVNEVKKNNVVSPKETYLFASIIKKDNFEWIAQKATELGVTHIIPILSARSEKKDLNFERINKIVIEAAEQSGRAVLPIVSEVMKLEEALHRYNHVHTIVMHTKGSKLVSQDLKEINGIYIGPEGGWSDEEIELFKKNEIPVYSLGPQVLRAETAVIAALTLLIF
jgi:16S rRNA (uracil1498-N3)-methyltransferase